MRHYVQYHHTGRFGPPEDNHEGGFWMMTRKRASGLPGSVVWMFLGEGRPRQYSVYKVFRVDEVLPAADPDFSYRVFGEKGVWFRPYLEVTDYSWFRRLKRRLGNFSLGLTEVTGTYSQCLLDLARQFSGEFREAEAKGWFQDE